MKYFVLIVLLSFTVTNCPKEDISEESHAYFGGEIVNPNDKRVIISRGQHIIDTILLNNNNRFLYKIEDLIPGVYTFRHSPEEQVVLLESGDSLHFRLNTIEFDESLVFTGNGAKKNNYLINLYLQNELEREHMLEYSQLSPEEFDRKIDSSKNVKHEKLKIFERKHSTSKLFNEIADANIHYDYYASKEIYPFAYYGENELKNLKSLPDGFYDYRKDIDYNNENLRWYFPYYRFLNSHFNNVALTRHFKHSNDSIFNRHSLDYNLDKLAVIDSLVSHDSIKNLHLWHTAKRYLFTSKNTDDIKELVSNYLRRSSHEKHKLDVEKLAESLMSLAPGKLLPNIDLINSKGQETKLLKEINKPTVVYFWTHSRRMQLKDSHQKAKKFKEKYPDLNFISINASRTTIARVNETLKQYSFPTENHSFPTENQYRFKEAKKARKDLVISSVTKVMFIDKDGSIINSHANMSDPLFEQQLISLINH